MEQNAIQWLGSPSCLRGSYAFYKSVRRQSGGAAQVLRLGEFYYIRCGPQEPACIAEVTLLWEEQVQRHLLASSRLYILPEDTSKGRTKEHGEDEVLAVSKKVVVRVEDLVNWTCSEPPVWTSRSGPRPGARNSLERTGPSSTDSEPPTHKTDDVATAEPHKAESRVRVLSYPQYCRYRSLQRRIQDRGPAPGGPGLQDPLLLALGALRGGAEDTRVLYCRDAVSHTSLSCCSNLWTPLRCTSISLKGRPRKRRGRDRQGVESPSPSQSETWVEKMKENVMDDVEMSCEGAWLPHPEEQLFLDQLFVFMERRGSAISKVPNLGFKKIDLFLMYSVVRRLGGYERVTSERLWKVVYNELGGCPGSTSAATCTRRHYERLMLPYEEHINGGGGGAELKLPESSGPPKTRGMRGRPPLAGDARGRKPGMKPAEKKAVISAPLPEAVSPEGGAVVKRGRGRPPGRRNKATILAQAKLLAQAKAKAAAAAQPPAPKPSPGPADPSLHNQAIFQELNLTNMPLTPDLSPMSTPFLPFQSNAAREGAPQTQSSSPALFSPFPRLPAGGPLGGFSPTKGLCPLDVFRNRLGLNSLDHPVLTLQDPCSHQPSIAPVQGKMDSPDTPVPSGDEHQPPSNHHPHQCSWCGLANGAHKGGSREGRVRPPLPPLRVLPLDLDCSLQVRQLMRTPLGSDHLQSFTKRLSEVLSQDLPKPCSPDTPPPDQALPLNLSKRPASKRPSSDSPDTSGGDAAAKRPKLGPGERVEDQVEAEDLSLGLRSRGGLTLGPENQEEPADLSSPSRIRAFLLELPPFQVKQDDPRENSWGRTPSLEAPPAGRTLPGSPRVEDGGTMEEEEEKGEEKTEDRGGDEEREGGGVVVDSAGEEKKETREVKIEEEEDGGEEKEEEYKAREQVEEREKGEIEERETVKVEKEEPEGMEEEMEEEEEIEEEEEMEEEIEEEEIEEEEEKKEQEKEGEEEKEEEEEMEKTPGVDSDKGPGEDCGTNGQLGPTEAEDLKSEVEVLVRDRPSPALPQPKALALSQKS